MTVKWKYLGMKKRGRKYKPEFVICGVEWYHHDRDRYLDEHLFTIDFYGVQKNNNNRIAFLKRVPS